MPFEKGKSGNPGGRNKLDKPITEALRLALKQNDQKALNNLISVWISRALAGDMTAILGIIDRVEGKPLQQTENHNVNEHRFVKVPDKASHDEWKQFLLERARQSAAVLVSGPSNGSGNSTPH